MNKLNSSDRARIAAALVEGNSVNSTARLCRVSKLTVLRLLADLGSLCREFHDVTVCDLKCERVQVDEIWSYVAAKAKNVATMKKPVPGAGDAQTRFRTLIVCAFIHACEGATGQPQWGHARAD